MQANTIAFTIANNSDKAMLANIHFRYINWHAPSTCSVLPLVTIRYQKIDQRAMYIWGSHFMLNQRPGRTGFTDIMQENSHLHPFHLRFFRRHTNNPS